MRVIKTNWVNLLGVFLATFVFSCLTILIDENLSYNVFQAIIAALFSVFGFGMMFWALFIVLLVVLDLILIIPNKGNLRMKLIIE